MAAAKRTVILDIDCLERARLSRGLFRKEVAQMAAVCPSSVYRAFSGGAVGVGVARRIAKVLDLDLASLWIDGGPVRARARK